MLCVVGDRIASVFLASLAHSVDRTVGSICTAVTKVVDLSALEHLTGLDVCEDCAAITLGLLRLVPRRNGEKYMNPRVHKNGQLVYLVLKSLHSSCHSYRPCTPVLKPPTDMHVTYCTRPPTAGDVIVNTLL